MTEYRGHYHVPNARFAYRVTRAMFATFFVMLAVIVTIPNGLPAAAMWVVAVATLAAGANLIHASQRYGAAKKVVVRY